jgi:hypothetical protein
LNVTVFLVVRLVIALSGRRGGETPPRDGV